MGGVSGDLVQRVHRFLRDPASGDFEDLALAAFAFQVGRIPAWRALAEARGARPGEVATWREVPPVPALAFKTTELVLERPGAEEPETFRSSGTTGRARSVHVHPFPGLYRAAIDASFPRHCLPGPAPQGGLPVLSLVPPRAALPDSSLSFMVDHVAQRWGDPGATAWACGGSEDGGLDAEAAERWARRREEDRRPGLVLATAFALALWLDRLEAAGERLRLPEGTVLFETGGFKGRRRELSRDELRARVEDRLGVPPDRIVREYGMTELTSQLYTDVLARTSSSPPTGAGSGSWTPGPWRRRRRERRG